MNCEICQVEIEPPDDYDPEEDGIVCSQECALFYLKLPEFFYVSERVH